MPPVAGGAAAVAAASAAKAGLKAEARAPRILASNFGTYHSLDDLPNCQNLQVSKSLYVMFIVVCAEIIPCYLCIVLSPSVFGPESGFGIRVECWGWRV